MARAARRVVTGHDASGKSVILSDGPPPQNHPMQGRSVGADFIEMWNTIAAPAPISLREPEPNERPFRMMPAPGGLIRLIDIYPLSQRGQRTVMHRTKTIDCVVVIEGELTLLLDDGSETTLHPSDVVIQRGTNHAWENRGASVCRAVFMHFEGEFAPELRARLPEKLDLMT